MKLDTISYIYISIILFGLVILFTSKTFDTTILKGNEQLVMIFGVISIFLFFAAHIVYYTVIHIR
jgi:hypothetical protein